MSALWENILFRNTNQALMTRKQKIVLHYDKEIGIGQSN